MKMMSFQCDPPHGQRRAVADRHGGAAGEVHAQRRGGRAARGTSGRAREHGPGRPVPL